MYCIVPRALADTLHDVLRRHFRDVPAVEVVVESRLVERRARERRVAAGRSSSGPERRVIQAEEGLRVADRRVPTAVVAPLELPRRARVHAGSLTFVERLEPSTQHLEDVETARLVTQFQAGSDRQEDFAVLYRRYFDRVYSYMRLVLNDPHEAEDATQQVFLNAFEALPRYERRRQPFRAWLFVIARNQGLNRLRTSRRPVTLMDPTDISRHEDVRSSDDVLTALGWLSDRDLLLLVERLPLAQRQALALRYMLDLSASQIAEILDRSPDDVRMLQHRALAFLRQRLAALGRPAPQRTPGRARGRLREATVLRARRFAITR